MLFHTLSYWLLVQNQLQPIDSRFIWFHLKTQGRVFSDQRRIDAGRLHGYKMKADRFGDEANQLKASYLTESILSFGSWCLDHA